MPLELFKKSGAEKKRKKHKEKLEFGKELQKKSKKAEKAMKRAMGMFGKGKKKLIF
jgi:hypothetical protein